jgi:hypothetical protein
VQNEELVSYRTIKAIALFISGGSAGIGGDVPPPESTYRSGWQITQFLANYGVAFQVSGRSRVPALMEELGVLNSCQEAHEVLIRVIEGCVDPRDFLDDSSKRERVADYLNSFLLHDGLQLHLEPSKGILTRRNGLMDHRALESKLNRYLFDTTKLDFERALRSAESDPADGITAACSTVESVCRSILLEDGEELPAKLDISTILTATMKHLDLSPGREDVEEDVKKILGGMISVVTGIGALRTHAGDAHGREKNRHRVDARISRLSINLSNAMSLFFIETWERKRARDAR